METTKIDSIMNDSAVGIQQIVEQIPLANLQYRLDEQANKVLQQLWRVRQDAEVKMEWRDVPIFTPPPEEEEKPEGQPEEEPVTGDAAEPAEEPVMTSDAGPE